MLIRFLFVACVLSLGIFDHHLYGASVIAEGCSHDSKGINVYFLAKFFSEEAIATYHHSPTLYRLPACGRGATHKEYLNAICASLGIGLTGGRNVQIVPTDCETLEDQQRVIRIIYEYLYKLQLYGFGQLIPNIIKKIESTAVVPGSIWLSKHWREIKNDKHNLTITIPADTD